VVVHTCNLRTQESEAGVSCVWGQSGLHSETLSKKRETNWTWWLIPKILTTQEAEIRRIAVQGHPRQINLSWKYPRHKAGRVAQVFKRLPSKHETLSSRPTSSKKKKRRNMGTILTFDIFKSVAEIILWEKIVLLKLKGKDTFFFPHKS
jgi:hypothetical protein